MLRELFNNRNLFCSILKKDEINNLISGLFNNKPETCLIVGYKLKKLFISDFFDKIYYFDVDNKFEEQNDNSFEIITCFDDLKNINIDIVIIIESNFDEKTLNAYLSQIYNTLKQKGKILIVNLMSMDRLLSNEDLIYFEIFLKNMISCGFKIKNKKFLDLKDCEFIYDFGNIDFDLEKVKLCVFSGIKDEFRIRNYKKGDEFKINEMFQRIFNTTRSIKAWYWKFSNNPFGNFEIKLCIDKIGQIVGHYSGYYAPLDFDGKIEKCVQIGDIMTEKHVRNKGLGENGILARLATCCFLDIDCEQVPFVYGFNTSSSRKISERFTKVEYFENDFVNYYEIINFNNRYGILFKFKFSFEKISFFSEDFDRFYKNVRKHYPKLLIKRSSEYLNWRYSNPDKNYNIVAIKKFGKLCGYFVYVKTEDIVEMGDIFIDKKNEIFNAVLYYFEKNNYNNIRCWLSNEPEWLNEFFKNHKFEKKTEPNYLSLGFRILNPKFKKEFLKSFYYTKSDSDLF